MSLDEDFCLPVTGRDAPLSVVMPSPAASKPQPAATSTQPIVLEPLDDDLPLESAPRSRRALPAFQPFKPEVFLMAKNPWAVHSVADLIRFFLPEISIAAGLMAGCGLMAGRLLARWTGVVQPLGVVGLYLGILFLHIGGLYLANKGCNSSQLKASMRQLVIGSFLLFLPHSVAQAVLTMGD